MSDVDLPLHLVVCKLKESERKIRGCNDLDVYISAILLNKQSFVKKRDLKEKKEESIGKAETSWKRSSPRIESMDDAEAGQSVHFCTSPRICVLASAFISRCILYKLR
ncbi:uncharacterized protein C8R40DRAFT_680438 [Lentinula edodes]|uniref:uncharacterized protein n=1 Tax=Lentinula edodes TaxID=5353 RepID=UPI001E8D7E86|nr:uncharacterized protein C8R40DRAFT_680438 [Lentinula edodes]KAH7878840.1 hypothetical protein C8R40DRAFT_680438 [Lentinula edodes]